MNRLLAMDAETHKKVEGIAKHGRCGVSRTRAIIIREVAQGVPLKDATAVADVSAQYARSVVRGFNEKGIASFPPAFRSGRPRKLGAEDCETIASLARQKPKALGQPWTTWSVSKIHEVLKALSDFPSVSAETVRKALHRCGITYQETKTWKQSNDPEFAAKYRRVKELYGRCPNRGAVICVDEFGPLECRPYHGKTWAARKRVPRLSATYKRDQGVRHLLAFYDVHADVLGGSIYKRKRGEEFLEFLQDVRELYPKQVTLYIVLDNFSPHKRADVLEWARKHKVEFAFTATNASWMNRIECHFGPLREFALVGTHPKNHEEVCQQIDAYLTWRNHHKQDARLKKEQRKTKVA